jgi:hypothetical protein
MSPTIIATWVIAVVLLAGLDLALRRNRQRRARIACALLALALMLYLVVGCFYAISRRLRDLPGHTSGSTLDAGDVLLWPVRLLNGDCRDEPATKLCAAGREQAPPAY